MSACVLSEITLRLEPSNYPATYSKITAISKLFCFIEIGLNSHFNRATRANLSTRYGGLVEVRRTLFNLTLVS